MKRTSPVPCPCGGVDYDHCCAPFHRGDALAETAEQLMRARYSAYVRRETPFLLASWHPTTRPPDAVLKESDVLSMMWLGLTVKHHETTGNKAIVEFIARFRQGGASAQRLHERSRFVREHGRWYYVDGDFVPD